MVTSSPVSNRKINCPYNTLSLSAFPAINSECFLDKSGDLLLYPANYGPDSSFTEGVSLNVLEMASLGVPSLITKNGCQTWPELLKDGIVREVDWTNLEEVANVINTEIVIPPLSELNKCREILDIAHNLSLHLSFK